jgi:hypothetical protein
MAIAEKIKSAWANRYTRYGSIAVVLARIVAYLLSKAARADRDSPRDQRCLRSRHSKKMV